MELTVQELRWIRALVSELAYASKESRGGLVFFQRQWVDETTEALRGIANKERKAKK